MLTFTERLLGAKSRRAALRQAGAGVLATTVVSLGAGLRRGFAQPLSGEVNALCWEGYVPRASEEAIETTLGPRVNLTFMGSPDDILAKLKGGGSGQIDVTTPYNGYVPVLHAAGLLQPIDTGRLANYGQLFANFQHPDWAMFDGSDYAVPAVWGSWPMCYNADAISEPPVSWLDVKKPEFKGKVVMGDDSVGSILVFGKLMGYPDPTRITQAELDAVIDFLIDIKLTQARAVASWSEMADILARGDAIISVGGAEAVATNAREKGANVRCIHTKEGDFAWVDTWTIAAEAPNLDNAYAFIDHMIGADGALDVATTTGYGTTNEAAVARMPEELRSLFPYDDMATFQRLNPQYGDIPSESDGGFTTISDWLKAWERFKGA